MPVTMGSAIQEVRWLLEETSAHFWTNTMLMAWLNQACKDIARETQSLWQQHTFAAVVTPPTPIYLLPTDMLGVHKLTFLIKTGGVSSQQWFNLEYRGIKQMDEIWGILHQLPAAYPNAFYLWNDPTPPGTKWYVGIYPVPATTGTFTLYYYRTSHTAETTSTHLDIVQGYEDVAYEYAVYKAKRRDRDPTWQTAFNQYARMLQTMKDATSRFSDESNQFVNDANAQWPVYLYTSPTGW